MNKLMHFSNKELFLQILSNIHSSKAFKYAIRLMYLAAAVGFVYVFIKVMTYITDFVNYVFWGF